MVPAHCPAMLAEARALPAEICLDLEDVVGEERRAAERSSAVAPLEASDRGSPPRAVRVSGSDVRWFVVDVLPLPRCSTGGTDLVLTATGEDGEPISFAGRLLEHGEGASLRRRRVGIDLLVESPTGPPAVNAIATACPPIEALIFAALESAMAALAPLRPRQRESTCLEDEPWEFALAHVAAAAWANALQGIDGPCSAVRASEVLDRSISRSQTLGFDGKLVVHPTQIAACNGRYAPSDEQLRRAIDLLEPYAAIDTGAGTFEREMIDAATWRVALGPSDRARAAGMVS